MTEQHSGPGRLPLGRPAGGEPPRLVPAREGYDLWSSIYDNEDNPLIALEEGLVRGLLGDVRDMPVADIGCGTGRHALAMAEAGARVTALDFSMGMLSKAVAKPGADSVRFVLHDLQRGLPFVSSAFARITCCLVLEHVADLDGTIAELARICRRGGAIIISELHPAMRLLGVQAQFTDPGTGRKTWPASVAHQLSDYVMAAARADLRIDHMSEHVVDERLSFRSPRAAKYLGWPLLMVLRLRAPGKAT